MRPPDRDALPAVRSARVLYPGNVAREFPALDPVHSGSGSADNLIFKEYH
jgi:hypothetical protein